MSDPLSVEQLVAAACGATGLSDFGEPPLHPALDHIVTGLNDEARLNVPGRAGREQALIGVLVNRLLLQARLTAQPDLLDDPVGTPVVVVGLPRSGTTKLQRMLAADRRLNSIKFWECLSPVPLSDSPDDVATRIGFATAYSDALRQSPEFFAAHPVIPEEPEEEMVVMRHSLLNESLDAEVRVPSYIRWLQGQDRGPMYAQLAVFLRLLARQHDKIGDPWILKGTYHGAHLDTLLEHLPNARIVYCHRDPVQTIASYCSLVSKMRRLSSDDVDEHDVGQELMNFWPAHLEQTLAARARVPAENILDLAYTDIVADGLGAAERIYDFAGLELTEQARADLAGWNADNAQHKHGRHSYDVTDYGLTDELIAQACDQYRKQFADYLDRK